MTASPDPNQASTVKAMASQMRFPETIELNDGLDNILGVEVNGNEVRITITQPPAIPDDEYTFTMSHMQWDAAQTLINRKLNE